MRRSGAAGIAGAAAIAIITTAGIAAADTTVRIDENPESGWGFNLDPGFSTPAAFSTDAASIGSGSLHVAPIQNDDPDGTQRQPSDDKFILGRAMGSPVADLVGFSIDFMVDGSSDAAAPWQQFYVNVYTNLPGSSTYYDCRFDHVATSGSSVAFTELAVDPSVAATAVADRANDGFDCPAQLDAMPAGSTISAIAVNIGDTSAADQGIGGYLDRAVLTSAADGTTVYDFELTPADAADCKAGGFAGFGFANQGRCVSAVRAAPHTR